MGNKPTHRVYAEESKRLAALRGPEAKPRLVPVGSAWEAAGGTLQIALDAIPTFAFGHAQLKLVAFRNTEDEESHDGPPIDDDLPL